MKCPKCGYPRVPYKQRNTRTLESTKNKALVRAKRKLYRDVRHLAGSGRDRTAFERTDYSAKCPCCGYEWQSVF